MLLRRLLILAAVLMLLSALAAGLSPREENEPASSDGTLPAGTTVTKRISAEPTANSRVVVRRGDLLELEVAGDVLDSVLIERLDRMDAIEPRTPARFNMVVDAAVGTYPIRLVEADRRIGSVVVRD